jgi:Zn-dependent M28 family amino/carboxypeptidase
LIGTLDGGSNWIDLDFPFNQNLNDLHFPTGTEGWVVGLGAVHHTTDGGSNWEDQSPGVQSGDVNVVGTIPGTTNPEEIYIICGHYDSISQMPETYAPGADDNGTGTVGVIEAARVLKEYSFESTLRFVCFSREEQGLVGSGAYAREAWARGDSIVGALNFDMIGYVDESPEDLDVLYNGISEWLADEYVAAAALYVPGLDIVTRYQSYVPSDNSSFWDYNYPAFCGIEDSPLNNPYYHRTTDRVSTVDFDFYTDVVKAAVATLAGLARIDTSTSSVAWVPEPALLRVSPNPGRGEIAIEMSGRVPEPEEFRVYSVEGKLVNTLEPIVDGARMRATWDGTDVTGKAVGPGIYFVRIAGRSTGTKVVLLR